MSSRLSYVRIFAAVVIIVPAIVAAINVAVDPWDYFGTRLISGLNVLKPEMGFHEKGLTAHRLRALRPDGLILGASTSDVGLDPEHPGWSVAKAYNAAAGLSSISLTKQLLMHAMEFRVPGQVVLGLDLGMFNPALQTDPGLNPSALAVTASGERNREYLTLNHYAQAFSLKMLASSFNALESNRKEAVVVADHRPQISALGMMNPERFREAGWKIIRQRFQVNVSRAINSIWAPLDAFNAIDDFSSDPTFDAYRQVIRLACENNMELHILVSPTHAYMLVGLDVAGLTGLWERWLKAVVMMAAEQAESSGCAAIPVWDFSGYNPITTEVIANTSNVADSPQWYWDTIHYKKEVGDEMLNRVFGYNSDSGMVDFGVRLTPANIDEHIIRNRELAAQYRSLHADEVALVSKTAEAALQD